MNSSKKLSDIRENHYKFQREDAIKQFGIYLEFKKNPYTFLRWKMNMEISTFLIYFFIRTNLSANFITIIYILLAPFGFFLIISGNNSLVVTGLIVFFLKNIFDFVDGYIARYRKESSLKGAALDSYGAFVGDIFFKCGVSIFLFNQYNEVIFLYCAVIILLCNALSINHYCKSIFFDYFSKNPDELKNYRGADQKDSINKNIYHNLKRSFIFLESIFDDRVRSVDLMLLLILLNVFFDIKIISYILFFITFKSLLKLIATFINYFLK